MSEDQPPSFHGVSSARASVQRRRPVIAALQRWLPAVLLSVASATVLVAALQTRPEAHGVFMDQMSYLLQSVSIAQDGDLRYAPEDRERFLALGWADQPHGLFLRRAGGDYYFAKPAAYALLAAPLAWLVPSRGPVVLNGALWVGLLLLSDAWLRRWMAGIWAAVLSIITWVFSTPIFYVFVVHMDVFVMFLLALCLYLGLAPVADAGNGAAPGTGESPDRAALRIPVWHAAALGVCGGLLTYSRALHLPFVVAILALWWVSGLRRAALLAGAAFVVPILLFAVYHYSEDGSFTPFQGDRVVVGESDPFTTATVTKGLKPTDTNSYYDSQKMGRRLTGNPAGFMAYLPRFCLSFLAGRRAGMFPHMTPFLLMLAVGFAGLGRPEGRRALWVLVPGAVCMLLLFRFTPEKWQGGGTGIGSRYIAQMAPAFVFSFGWTRPRNATLAGVCLMGLIAAAYFPGRLLFIPADALRDNYNIFQWEKYRFLPVEPEMLMVNCDKPGAKVPIGEETYAFHLTERPRGEALTTLTLAGGGSFRMGLVRNKQMGEAIKVKVRSMDTPVSGLFLSGWHTTRFELPASSTLTLQPALARPVAMRFADPVSFYWPLEIRVNGHKSEGDDCVVFDLAQGGGP